jgi:peptidoglycan/LPS O-acetylase OafA/YrhL
MMIAPIIILIIILSLPVMLIATYAMLENQKILWKMFLIHCVIFLAYIAFLIFFSGIITGHDEYGLGKLAFIIIFVVCHIVIGFIQALFVRYKNSVKQ